MNTMSKRMLFFTVLFLIVSTMFAQNYTVSGYIEDSQTGEKLMFANIADSLSHTGISSNDYGFYSITIPKGKIKLIASYVGYSTKIFELDLNQDTLINFALEPYISLNEVVIKASKGEFLESTQTSLDKISVISIKEMPVLAGEVDLIKSIQLLPGVHVGTEGTGGLHVRGGDQSENLILMDGAPVYNVNHLFGFFSVFNVDAIQDVQLMKGGFPARYGGRLSSVLDVKLKEGNNKEFAAEGSIGLISSRLTIEGPIIKDRTSFIVSGRRTYIDLLTKPFLKGDFIGGYYFYDLTAKINHKFSDKSQLFLSAYTGKDKLDLEIKNSFFKEENKDTITTELDWSNYTAIARWNYIASKKLFINTSLIYTKYSTNNNTKATSTFDENLTNYSTVKGKSFVEDIIGKCDLTWYLNNKNNVRAGVSYIYHTFLPYDLSREMYNSQNTFSFDTTIWGNQLYSHETRAYIEDDILLTGRLKANIGLSFVNYTSQNKSYNAFEPRLSIRYLLNEKVAIKAAYSRMNQFIHLVPNIVELSKTNNSMNISLSPEIWLPVSSKLLPSTSDQYVLGGAYEINNMYNLSIETFYKSTENVVGIKENIDQVEIVNWEDHFDQGHGTSYGLELLFKKNTGKLRGLTSYTLSKTDRQFTNQNGGEAFPFVFDRRHQFNVTMSYQLKENISVQLSWVYASGRSFTLPDEQYISLLNFDTGEVDANTNDIITSNGENLYRMPAYHRLDLGINFTKEKKWGTRIWRIGVYNAYNRKNAFMVYIDYDELGRNSVDISQKKIKTYSIFPIIPSINYSFKF